MGSADDDSEEAESASGPANLKKLLDSFDKLTIEEKNTLIGLFNAMLDDKGKFGGKLWDVIQQLVKDKKLTNEEGQEFCKMGYKWPKLIKVDYYQSPKGLEETIE